MRAEVSIIVPSFQQGKYLNDTLKSVQQQTFTNWECLIINDGSTDETETIALKFCKEDTRFKYFSQDNSGVSIARNLGLQKAVGNFIQFLDGDDLLQPNKLMAQVNFLQTNNQVDIIYGSSRYFFDGREKELYPIHYLGWAPAIEMCYIDTQQIAVMVSSNVAAICATLYRRKIFDVVKQFQSIVYEDWLFHIECALNNFTFHFERQDDAFCLIRMTEQSQMARHTKENANTNQFNIALNNLLEIHHYQSPLIGAKQMQSNNFKETLVKKIVRNALPPIFFKFIYKLNKKHK